MAIYLKGNGCVIRLMGMGFIRMLMARNMKGSGKMIYNMGKEWKHGRIILSMKGIMLMGRRKGVGFICGLMGKFC